MTEENKQLFTPVEEEKPKEEKKIDVDALISELEKVNLTDPDKLKGKLKNAAGFSSVQAEKDRLAHEVSQLRSEMEQMKYQSKKVNIDDFDGFQDNAIDIETTIEKVLDRRDAKHAQQQFERQKQQMAAYQKITKNKYWNEVRPLFEGKLQDPDVNMQVQMGQLDPVELFHEATVEYFQDLSKKSLEALQLASGTKIKPPHVENSARTPTQDTDTRDDKQKEVDKLREMAAKGGLHQDDQMKLINATLGDFIKQ